MSKRIAIVVAGGATAIVVVLVVLFATGAFSADGQKVPSAATGVSNSGNAPISGGTSELGSDAATTPEGGPNTSGSATTPNSSASSSGDPVPAAGSAENAQLEADARGKGLYVLKGRAHVHYEDWGSGKGNVVSISLEEPLQYEYTYKGRTSTEWANEVVIAYEDRDGYESWIAYDGNYAAISCESLSMAIHDAPKQGVDALSTNPRLLYTR